MFVLQISDPGFKSALRGPDVTQKSRNDPTTADVCWMQIIKNPKCADGYNIYYWPKLTGSMAQVKNISTFVWWLQRPLSKS